MSQTFLCQKKSGNLEDLVILSTYINTSDGPVLDIEKRCCVFIFYSAYSNDRLIRLPASARKPLHAPKRKLPDVTSVLITTYRPLQLGCWWQFPNAWATNTQIVCPFCDGVINSDNQLRLNSNFLNPLQPSNNAFCKLTVQFLIQNLLFN